MTCQFIWKEDQEKPIGSLFVGTSPEFEFGLYTLMFMMDKIGPTPIIINDEYEVEIAVYPLGKGIGTAYPISKCD